MHEPTRRWHGSVTSRVAQAEAASAVARRENGGRLSRAEADQASKRLLADFTGPRVPYAVLDVTPSIATHAAELTRQHRLRALDAIHLASGAAARFHLPAGAVFQFGSADMRLNAAVTAESLQVFDPRSPIPSHVSAPVTPAE